MPLYENLLWDNFQLLADIFTNLAQASTAVAGFLFFAYVVDDFLAGDRRIKGFCVQPSCTCDRKL